MRYINATKIKENMIIAKNLYDNHNRILIKANKRISRLNINQINRLNINGIYIFDDNDKNNLLISEDTRLQAIKNLEQLNIEQCLYLANKIVDEICENNKHIIEQLQFGTFDKYTYNHCVNVTTYSVLIGIGMGFTDNELRILSQAALLHDIGKIFIDKNIIDKNGALTDEEYNVIKHHPEFGYDLLFEKYNIDDIVCDAILQHHENENGTGYPYGLKSDEINKYAKIIHVTDVYDALTSKRSYKKEVNPADALEYLYAYSHTLFDINVVNIFAKYITIYPAGEKVVLSNGHCATIYQNNDDFLSRPIVKIDTGDIVNLKEKLNITIINMQKRMEVH